MNLIKKLFGVNDKNISKKRNITYEDELLQQFGKIEEKNIKHINILIITDTHNCLYYDQVSMEIVKNSEYDVCLILGDVSNNDIFEILKYVPYDKIWGILGNHDGLDRFEEFNIRNLNGKVINVNGVKIAAIQGSHRYKQGNYGMYTHEESLKIKESLNKGELESNHRKTTFTSNRHFEDSIEDNNYLNLDNNKNCLISKFNCNVNIEKNYDYIINVDK